MADTVRFHRRPQKSRNDDARYGRPVELRLHLHAEHATGGRGAEQEDVQEAVYVDAIQSETHVEVELVLELVDVEGSYDSELDRARNEGH
jgi:hypothetical protein